MHAVATAWREHRIHFLSSAITFDTIVAAIPFVLLVFGVVGWMVEARLPADRLDVHTLLEVVIPSAAGVQELDPFGRVERLLDGVVTRRGALSLYGAILFLLLSTRAFSSIRTALNIVFHTPETRTWVRAKLTDLVLVLVTGVFLLANALISLRVTLPGVLGAEGASRWFAEGVAFVAVLALFVVVYRVAPDRRITWDTAWVAGGVCAVTFEVAKRLYAHYLHQITRADVFTLNAQVMGLLLLVVWFYLMAVVFLTAAEVAEEYHGYRTRRRAASAPGPPLVSVHGER